MSIDGGAWPRWSASGDELFFMSGEELYTVSVQTNPSLSLGTPRILFTRTGDTGSQPFGWADAFDVSRDGRQFLILQPAEDGDKDRGPRGLIVAQNWFAEFRSAD